MAYRYDPPPANAPSETRKRIVLDFRRWNEMDPGAVGAYDFPPPAKIGSQEATLRFELRGTPIEMKCSKFESFNINFTAIALAINAMRLNEARGIDDTLREAYALLPAPARDRDPYEVLGALRGTPLDDLEDLYKVKAQRLHPDKGGDPARMKELNAAMDRIREELK